MIGPFRTLLQTRFQADARDCVARLAREQSLPIVVEAPGIIALRFNTMESGTVRTTTEVIADEKTCSIRTRLYASDKPLESDVPIEFVRAIVAQTDPYDVSLPIRTDYQVVAGDDELKAVTNAILDPQRFLPIVVMSEPAEEELLAIAPRLCAIAHIFLIVNRLSHGLIEAFGPNWPTHGGAMRTFGVPFPSPRDDHPLALASNRPTPEVFLRRVRYFAVNLARDYPFPSIDALAAAYNAQLPA